MQVSDIDETLMLLLFEMGVIWDLHRSYIGLATKMQ